MLAKVAAQMGRVEQSHQLWEEARQEGFVPDPEQKREDTQAVEAAGPSAENTVATVPDGIADQHRNQEAVGEIAVGAVDP